MSKKQNCKEGVCPSVKTSIGGQALMEGIMMRGPQKTAMAVRNTKGEIVLELVPTSQKKRPAILKWPIIRGVVSFASSMALGYKCLMRSAELSGLEEIEAEMKQEKAAKKAAKAAKKAGKTAEVPPEAKAETEAPAPETAESVESVEKAEEKADAPKAKAKKKGMSPLMWVVTVLSSILVVAIVVGLFMWLPTFLYGLLAKAVPWFEDPAHSRYMQSVFEGVVRVILLVAYMALISLMKDIRRTFMYHGAEHKTIFCYEKGLELTVENVKKQKRFHPRCGTSFLILMMLVSIFVGFLIPPSLQDGLRVAIKLLLVPVIMGIGFELIKFCGRHDNWLTRVIAAPGVALQHITVFEPDDGMIECAIAAVKEVIPEDGSDRL